MRIRKTVNVSKKDIRHGVAGDCSACPLAKAIGRVLQSAVRVSLTREGNPYFRFADSCVRHSLPPKALTFMTEFDRGKPVESFGFTLFYTD